jgi:hypothetical protein
MAYEFVTASSQSMDWSPATVTSSPFTMAALFNPANPLVTGAIISTGLSTSTTNNRVIYSLDTGVVRAQETGSATADTGSILPSVWQHAAGVFLSNSSRSAFFNGGSKVTNGTSVSPQTPDRMSIGRSARSTNQGYFNGQLCECAVWSAALTDAEIASLGKGFKPYRIRPQSLVFYAPLIRNVSDMRGGVSITNNGSATVANHPRVY